MAKNFRLSLDNGQSAVSVSLIVPLRPLSTVKNIEKLVLRERDSYSNILPVTAIGGEGTIRLSISPEIPNGLTFSNTTGLINGTPQNSLDIRSFTVTAVDSQGQTSSQSFFMQIEKLVVLPPPPPPPPPAVAPPPPTFTPGSQTFTSNQSFTIPIGATRVTVTISSGGGGGGGYHRECGESTKHPGASGGNGFQKTATFNVNPLVSSSVNITIGQGGRGGLGHPSTAQDGGQGEATSVTGIGIFVAVPGGFGGEGRRSGKTVAAPGLGGDGAAGGAGGSHKSKNPNGSSGQSGWAVISWE